MYFRACLPQLPCECGPPGSGHAVLSYGGGSMITCLLQFAHGDSGCAGEPELAVAAGVLQRPVLVYSAVSAPG
jgi:hypothetical protein